MHFWTILCRMGQNTKHSEQTLHSWAQRDSKLRLQKLMGEACPCFLPCSIGSSAGFRCSSCLVGFLVQHTMCIQSVFFCYLSPSETALMHLLVPLLFVSSHWWVFWVGLDLVGGNMGKKKAWGRTSAWKCEFSSWSRHISGGLPTNQLSILQWDSRDCPRRFPYPVLDPWKPLCASKWNF